MDKKKLQIKINKSKKAETAQEEILAAEIEADAALEAAAPETEVFAETAEEIFADAETVVEAPAEEIIEETEETAFDVVEEAVEEAAEEAEMEETDFFAETETLFDDEEAAETAEEITVDEADEFFAAAEEFDTEESEHEESEELDAEESEESDADAEEGEVSEEDDNPFKEVDEANEAQRALSDEEEEPEEDGTDYIVFKNVKKTYTMGETQINALNGIDFSVNKGELVVVVGASGAGKTTILNILGGIDKATSGEVIIDGNDICKYNKKQMVMYRRHDVGFVFQFYNLVQNLTARENVELATQICTNPFDVDEMLEAVSLTDRKNNFPSQLSGGEQQRVAIARALAKNPKLLLCDEPTGALDYNTGKSILQLLQDTAREAKMTVFIITHNYALTGIGDRVVKVKNGMIEEVIVNENPTDIRDIEW